MTIKEIRAMFKNGSKWNVENTFRPQADGRRTVIHLGTTEFHWRCFDGVESWGKFPKASQIIEARDGYLQFRCFTETDWKANSARSLDHTLTLTRIGG